MAALLKRPPLYAPHQWKADAWALDGATVKHTLCRPSPSRENFSTMAGKRKAPPGWKWVFVARFWHWRAKKYLYAVDYGYVAWAFLVRA